MNSVQHGRSATFETKSSYCRAKVEFNSINLVRHGNSTTFETGLKHFCKIRKADKKRIENLTKIYRRRQSKYLK